MYDEYHLNNLGEKMLVVRTLPTARLAQARTARRVRFYAPRTACLWHGEAPTTNVPPIY
jgi:hypothetical protein